MAIKKYLEINISALNLQKIFVGKSGLYVFYDNS